MNEDIKQRQIITFTTVTKIKPNGKYLFRSGFVRENLCAVKTWYFMYKIIYL
jgi:hypothetical protein